MILSGALLLMGAGCGKQAAVAPAANGTGEGAPAVVAPAEKPAEQAAASKMTDDQYVEITAALNVSLGKGELKYAGDEGFASLLKEKGVTQADWEAFNKELTANPTHASSLGLKVMQRLKELAK